MSTKHTLFLTAIMSIGSTMIFAQNTLPTIGNVGIGTATPSNSLEVVGTTGLDKVTVRDTAYFEKPVIIKDSVTMERKLTVEQDLRIKGKTVVDDNFRAKSNVVVLGTTRMKGNAIAEGNFRFLGLADSTLSDERFLMIKPNGRVESMEKGGLQNLIYLPSNLPCFVDQNGNLPAPVWSNVQDLTGQSGIIYTGLNCGAKVGINTNAPTANLDVHGTASFLGNTSIGTGLDLNNKLTLFQNAPNSNGLIITHGSASGTGVGLAVLVSNNQRVGFKVNNTVANRDVFSVLGDGKVSINGTSPISLEIKTNNYNNACIAFKAQSEQSDLLFFDRQNVLRGVFRHSIENGKSVYTLDDRSSGTAIDLMKLSSDGSLYAHEIKVKTGTFPDYVFKEGYSLMSIKEVDDYIKKEGRLPNMPVGVDVIANGLAVGEMEVKLVEKIEELTLYIIELEKKYEQILQLLNE